MASNKVQYFIDYAKPDENGYSAEKSLTSDDCPSSIHASDNSNGNEWSGEGKGRLGEKYYLIKRYANGATIDTKEQKQKDYKRSFGQLVAIQLNGLKINNKA